ncbi:DMT family transporter [Acinetobacter defluvii]|uniref:DMT family transporter n=1 Tax=Acinetobacter defluvii TaxID=1871111 RepID=A0A2S2FBV2_9GAMM|nr:DMT family transporter [Acinetobacter defluvii]AWL28451.1 DMT family transporter [Acinetobacter defluvii]
MNYKIVLAMLAFAANSVLCRLALAQNQIDPMSFSVLRVLSGVIVLSILFVITNYRLNQKLKLNWNIKHGFFLAVYVTAFSLAYVKIDAGVGALILFGTVQLTMVIYGLAHGERLNFKSGSGLLLAVIGIIVLLLPGASAPNLMYSLIMLISGLAWAAYSISGKGSAHPLVSTYSNFIIALPLVLIFSLFFIENIYISSQGIILAFISGGLASSGAYVLWYSILKYIDRITASTVQLSVPCLSIIGGSLFIGEMIGWRIIFSSILVLCGILLVIFSTAKTNSN